ncbi:hypothetical protein [Pseudoduganella ginsengisoli]|uniref:Uncharacterized protein n=1 Tax=Pseudoduganella ginsengisoli TaxID=1462440 RepID=A0A6L6Q708_9BURK|nr:hypothetical protein [Pseudoduganella ginsengisoli]MTW05385.1 hypothetical protein [Pseudoduganella ginsengisoli]
MHQFATIACGTQFRTFDQGAVAAHEVKPVKPLSPAGFDGIYEVKVLLAIHDTKRYRTGKMPVYMM